MHELEGRGRSDEREWSLVRFCFGVLFLWFSSPQTSPECLFYFILFCCSVTLLVEKDNWGPIDKSYGKKTSSKKQGEQNPVYGETFTWEIPDLKNMVLYVKVMDSK